ncbi:G protein-coupled receptor, partial [Operophtera brumata]
GYRGGGTSKRREHRRFTIYAVYAWGVPLALTAVTAAMQFSDETAILKGAESSRSDKLKKDKQ